MDVGGTLLPDAWPSLDRDRRQSAARLCQRAPALAEAQAADIVESLAAVKHPASSRQMTAVLVDETIRRHGLEAVVSPEEIIDAMCLPAAGRVTPFPGGRDMLASLAERSRIVIVTNVMWRPRQAQQRDFEELGLGDHISDYVTSLDVGWRKPDRRFFDAALAAGGADADRCVIVGDSETNDIEPAIALGMTAVRVAIEEPRPSASAAHHVCTSLAHVAALGLNDWSVG